MNIYSIVDGSDMFKGWNVYKCSYFRCHVIHHLPSMHGHVMLYITYHWYMVIAYYTSPTIDAWSCHVMHQLLSISYHSSPIIDGCSCLLLHHIPSMDVHVLCYITYHRCIVMSCDALPTIKVWSCYTIDAWSCHVIHQLLSISYDSSPTIDGCSCLLLHHLPSKDVQVLCYITYHWVMVMSDDTPPTIDAWSCQMIHHLPSHVRWYVTYHRCNVMSYDTSPTIPCHVIHRLPLMYVLVMSFPHIISFSCGHCWAETY